MAPDEAAVTLTDRVTQIARGTPYVLSLLEPTPDEHLDAGDFDAAVAALAGAAAPRRSAARFQIWVASPANRPPSTMPPTVRFAERSRFSEINSRCGWSRGCRSRRSAGPDSGMCCADVSRCSPSSAGVSLVSFDRADDPEATYAAGLYAPGPGSAFRHPYPQQVALSPGTP
jgi:hypothetical protein